MMMPANDGNSGRATATTTTPTTTTTTTTTTSTNNRNKKFALAGYVYQNPNNNYKPTQAPTCEKHGGSRGMVGGYFYIPYDANSSIYGSDYIKKKKKEGYKGELFQCVRWCGIEGLPYETRFPHLVDQDIYTKHIEKKPQPLFFIYDHLQQNIIKNKVVKIGVEVPLTDHQAKKYYVGKEPSNPLVFHKDVGQIKRISNVPAGNRDMHCWYKNANKRAKASSLESEYVGTTKEDLERNKDYLSDVEFDDEDEEVGREEELRQKQIHMGTYLPDEDSDGISSDEEEDIPEEDKRDHEYDQQPVELSKGTDQEILKLRLDEIEEAEWVQPSSNQSFTDGEDFAKEYARAKTINKLLKRRRDNAKRQIRTGKVAAETKIHWPEDATEKPTLDENPPNLDSKYTKGGKPINMDDYFVKKGNKRVKVTMDKHSPIYHIFQLMMSPEKSSLAVEWTKHHDSSLRREAMDRNELKKKSSSTFTKNITRKFFLYFCAVLIFIGIVGCTSVETAFEKEGVAANAGILPVGYQAAGVFKMKKDTFQAWMKHLSFSDRTKIYSIESDKFDNQQKVRKLIEASNFAYLRHWKPSGCGVIDEILTPFRGKWKYINHMPGKPGGAYGIKFYAAAECVNSYLMAITLFTTGQATAPGGGDFVTRVTMWLVNKVEEAHPGRVDLYLTDNYFTSITLALALFAMNKYLIGTTRAIGKGGRKGYPKKAMIDKKNNPEDRERGLLKMFMLPFEKIQKLTRTKSGIPTSDDDDDESSSDGEDDEDDENLSFDSKWNKGPQGIFAMGWHDSKPVHFISSCIGCGMAAWGRVSKASGKILGMMKPLIAIFYSAFMGAVDMFDYYNSQIRICIRCTRWTNKVFFTILISDVTNAWIIFKQIHKENDDVFQNISLRQFARRLCLELNEVEDAELTNFDYVEDQCPCICTTKKPIRYDLNAKKIKFPKIGGIDDVDGEASKTNSQQMDIDKENDYGSSSRNGASTGTVVDLTETPVTPKTSIKKGKKRQSKNGSRKKANFKRRFKIYPCGGHIIVANIRGRCICCQNHNGGMKARDAKSQKYVCSQCVDEDGNNVYLCEAHWKVWHNCRGKRSNCDEFTTCYCWGDGHEIGRKLRVGRETQI